MTEHGQSDEVRLEVRFLTEDARLPFRKRTTDAGYDLYSIEDVILTPKCSTVVHTGIQIAAPPGYYYTIEGRSSLWLVGIVPTRGIIDATYTGEVIVSLVNTTDEPYEVKSGVRVAQLILHKQFHAVFDIVSEFSPCYNQRGDNGFGSTGK
jgi:dUTP pyrophosphatase